LAFALRDMELYDAITVDFRNDPRLSSSADDFYRMIYNKAKLHFAYARVFKRLLDSFNKMH